MQTAPAYEDNPAVYLADILPPELLQSLRHRVEEVEVRQGKFHFYLESDSGPHHVATLGLLRERVREIIILGNAINQFSRDEEVQSQEIRGQLVIRSDRAIDIISRPVRSATDLAGQVADNFSETLTGPVPDVERDFIYQGGASSDPVAALHKRNAAGQWQLDIYSTNRRVQEFLDAVARVRSSGKISAATPVMNRQPVKSLKVADNNLEIELASLLKANDAAELKESNEKTLAGLNINADESSSFLQLAVFSPRHETRISRYLQQLDGVENLPEFLRAAGTSMDESDALAFEHLAMMLSYFHQNQGRIAVLHAGSRTGINAITEADQWIHFAVQDLIYWSPSAERFFENILDQAREAGVEGWQIVTMGLITAEARAELENRGYALLERFVF